MIIGNPKQLQKQILEENHSGIMHVVIYRYKKFIAIIDITIILRITINGQTIDCIDSVIYNLWSNC